MLVAAAALVLSGCTLLPDGESREPSTPAENPGATRSEVVGRWSGEDQRVHLLLDGEGAVSGDDGCNRLMGSWSLEGDVVQLSPLAATRMFCEGVDGWLSRAHSASIDGATMTVLDVDGAPIGTLALDD